MTIRNSLSLLALSISLFMGTACIDIDGDGNPDINLGAELCMGNFKEVASGGIDWDVCVGVGNGNQIGAPIQEDGITIEMVNKYAEQAQTDASYAITQANINCLIEDSDGGMVSSTPYVYTDGIYVYVYIPNVPSHFDADCSGNVTIGDGPGSVMFVDDNAVVETTLVMHEDELVQGWNEYSGELRIDND